MKNFIKSADETLDFRVDFAALTNGRGDSDWLQSGETISSAVVTVASGLTKDSDSLTDSDTSVTVWLSGGTSGNTYRVDVAATTNALRIAERSFQVKVVDTR